jgi:hypothetical protein
MTIIKGRPLMVKCLNSMAEYNDWNNLIRGVMGRPNSEIRILCDLDGTLCTLTKGNYSDAVPLQYAIDNLNKMHDLGYYIVIFTARYGLRAPDRQYQQGYEEAINWLKKYNVKFSEFRMGKPPYDIHIDDKSIRCEPNYPDHWNKVWEELNKISSKDQYGNKLNV